MNNLMIASIISMTGIAGAFAAILAIADKKLRVEEDPKIGEIAHVLPGVNCGACGYASCRAFAEAIVVEGAEPAKCRVISEESKEELFKLPSNVTDSLNTVVPST